MREGDNLCSDCGAEQPIDAPAGLCPQCLLRLGLGIDLSWNGESEEAFDPSIAGDSGFGWGRPSAVGSHPVSGILNTLDAAIGPVPRVLLRDGAGEDHRPVKPPSEEMPESADGNGRYQLIGEIARGGMGAILKGRDVDLGRDLAVKVILEEHRDHPEMVRRFVEEAQIGGQLQHPGIVPVHEIGRLPDGRLYIAMKLVQGRTLAALLEARREPADDRTRLLSIFEQICQTMAYAHSRGVIHRDLKPSNVMVGNFGEVQVMDWGLAKVLDQGGVADEEKALRSRESLSGIRTVRSGSDAGESRTGSVLGTPAYMAPEQARGALDTVDERADVFGLGSILCEILTGLPAYTGQTSTELYRKAEHADLADAFARLEICDADNELIDLVRSCLAIAPKNRPRDASQVLAGLTAYLTGVEQRLRAAGLAQAQAEGQAIAEHKRRVLTVALAGSLLTSVLILGGGLIWAMREQASRKAKMANEVNRALEEASLLRGQARARPEDTSKWSDAIAAAKRAQALLAQGETTEDLALRVSSVQQAISQERALAEASAKDRRVVERLGEIHSDFAVHFDNEKMDDEYSTAFRDIGIDLDVLSPADAGARIAARPDAAELLGALDHWIFSRRGFDQLGARRLIAVSRAADPDPWRSKLRDALDRKEVNRPPIGLLEDRYTAHRFRQMIKGTETGRAFADLEQLADSATDVNLPAETMARLAFALSSLGNREKAIDLLRLAERAQPDDFWINFDLASNLKRLGRFDEAIRFYSVAVAIRPRSNFARDNLGKALHDDGRFEDAAATYRQALKIEPENPYLHLGLAAVLIDQGRRDLAEQEFREAKRLRPNDGRIQHQIVSSRMRRPGHGEAIDALRKPLEPKPENAWSYDLVGMELWKEGSLDKAIPLFREAIRLNPVFAPAYTHLGQAILRQAEMMSHLDARLPAIRMGVDPVITAEELSEFAQLCSHKQYYAEAFRLWNQAFAKEPAFADDLKAHHRYHAAQDAARAGVGQGKEEPGPDAATREQMRRQAIAWLEADLKAYRELFETKDANERGHWLQGLVFWPLDPAFAEIRDPSELGKLVTLEREGCRALWGKVDALIQESGLEFKPLRADAAHGRVRTTPHH